MGALALRLLALLALRDRTLASGEPLCVEAALTRLLDTPSALRALADTGLANTNTASNILHADIAPVRLVCVFGRPCGSTLAESTWRTARRPRGLAKTHEALHALVAGTVEALMLAILARRQSGADIHILANRVLVLSMVGLVAANVVVCVAWMLLVLAVQALAIRALRLDGTGTLHLLRSRTGRRLRSRRSLEDSWVLDEGLGNTVARIVRRAVILALGVRWVVVRQRRRVTLLRALASIWLSLRTRLGRGSTGMLLRVLRVCRRKTGRGVWLLRTRQRLAEIVVSKCTPVAETRRAGIRVVKVPLRLAVPIIGATKVTKMRTLSLVLTELTERAIRAVLVLASRRSRGVEVRSFGLTEV